MAYTSVNKPTDYFNTKLYTGNGGTNAVTGVGFEPDWVWVKDRTSANSHGLFDVIRGSTNALLSNTTNATVTNANYLQSFNSDGFTLGSEGAFNTNTNNYASWNWLASNTTASNTDGSMTSTVSANTTAGFSIVGWTQSSGATFGHGLSQIPELFIHKRRTSTSQWSVYTTATGSKRGLELNSTGASFDASAVVWDSTTFTNFTGDSGDWISYCFHSVKGFSKIGSYTGNNNANGPFVYLGFRPAWVLVKDSGSGQHWHLIDSVREPFNDDDAAQLSPNSSDSESSVTTNRGTAKIDFLSNGFKINSDGSLLNGTGSFIYMAFAENPFVTSTGIPTTAR